MSSQATPAPPRPAATPRSTVPSLSRVGSAVPSRAGSTLRRLPPRKIPQKQQPARVEPPRSRCPNPECDKPDVQELDGQQTCLGCGATVPDSNIVSEVTFGESSTGAAVVQGGFVGEGQRHARTLGPAFKRAAQSNNQEHSESNGRDEIRKIANFLNTTRDSLIDSAVQIYKLAVSVRFIVGRRVRTVAAVCLYTACRRQSGESTILLMDFAVAIRVNVFKLGELFETMKKTLFLDQVPQDERGRCTIAAEPLIEVEALIQRYAQKLEFGDKTQRVANDAARIIQRMKRDWITTGRHPAGVCGACIILAARMNNFRRTVREVVYVVKVADMTVGKRLEEFNRTDSSALSVEQFRESGLRLKKQHDPPVLYDTRVKALKQAKKRKSYEMFNGVRGNPNQVEGSTNDVGVSPAMLRRDAEGFAIPPKPVPVDPSLRDLMPAQDADPMQATQDGARTPSRSPSPGPYRTKAKANRARKAPKPKKRRTKVLERPEMKILTADDLTDENQLETEIYKQLSDEEVQELLDEVKFNKYADKAKKAADDVRTTEREKRRQEVEDRRQQSGLIIDLGDVEDGSSDDESDADANEEEPSDQILRRVSTAFPAQSPILRSNSEASLVSAEGRVAADVLPTLSPSQPQTTALFHDQSKADLFEPMMSGALSTPPPTQQQSTELATQSRSREQDSPELLTPAPTQASMSLPQGPAPKKTKKLGRWDVSSDPEISPSEFDDDPEVKFCRLSEEDIRIKEVIWVTDNEEWLRNQQRKQLKRAMIEARGPPRKREGTASVESQAEGSGEYYGARKKRKRTVGKMGDGKVVEEGGKPQSAAEAAHRMINKRGKGFSRWYSKAALGEHLKKLYTARRSSSNNPTSSGEAESSRRETLSPSEPSGDVGRDKSSAARDTVAGTQSREGTQEIDASDRVESVRQLGNTHEATQAHSGEQAPQSGSDADEEEESERNEEMPDAEDELDELVDEFADDEAAPYEDEEEMGLDDEELYE